MSVVRVYTVFAALALLTVGSCAKNPDGTSGPRVQIPNTIGPSIAPASNVFVRNSFDKDPSRYIGRFLPNGDTALDETSTVKRACSEHIQYSTIEAGGTQREELFRSSASAALSIGIPPLIGGDASGGRDLSVLVRYTETTKMVSDIDDPAGFAACCADARNGCTDRYVSEFIEGTGEIYYAVGSEADLNAGVITTQVGANLEVKHGVVWQKATVFTNPVFFAFKVSPTDTAAAAPLTPGRCPDWVNNVPRSDKGMYFVGFSDPMDSERQARETAMRDGRVQTVRFLGESITTGTIQQSSVGGDMRGLSVKLEEQSVLEVAADGIARLVKDESWCVTEEPTPRGMYYKARVLAFLPQETYTEAADQIVRAAGPMQ